MQLTTTQPASRRWKYLDEKFYILQCIKRGIGISSRDPDYLVKHYLDNVAEYQLSPNLYFNERYYLARYPDVATSITSGQFVCGLDHYDRAGIAAGLCPHWFFDGTWYGAHSPDLDAANLRKNGLNDTYSHFLVAGLAERRPSSWFMMALGKVAAAATQPASMVELHEVLADPERLKQWLSPLFDADWFAAKYNTAGDPLLDIERYLLTGGRERLSPNPAFDEIFYQEAHPDVGTAVAAGTFGSAFEHFVLYGMAEGRRPVSVFDPGYYLSANPGVAEECRREGLAPFYHYLRYGRSRMLKIEPSFAERTIAEAAGKGLFERRAAINASLPLRLAEQENPAVSVIIIARNKYEQTCASIASIAVGTAASLEVIVYDNGSTDEVRDIATAIPGVRYLRSETNKGFTLAVNEAAAIARGRYVVLANNDIDVARGALDAAIRRLESDSSIGIVGARIIRSHGLLQEAGSIVWRDGSCLGYGRDFDPLDGRIMFPRDVDFCSGCFLTFRREDWEALGGFDPAYAPAYYEETDFCLRMWEAGKRVVYDPDVVLWHYEFGSSTLPEQAIALMRRNQRIFARKHAAALAGHLPASQAHVERARLRRSAHPRVLFIEDAIPDPARGMGFVRSAHVVETLSTFAGLVTVVGLHPVAGGLRRNLSYSNRGVTELLRDLNHTHMVEFLRSRIGVYDHLWLSRTHNLSFLRKWKQEVPEFFDGLAITIDTEAIASARVANQARLLGEEIDEAALVAEELAGVELAANVCAVNAFDRSLVEAEVRRLGASARAVILGHALPLQPRLPAYEDTRDIAIVGSFANQQGPNIDAVRWFDAEVRPLFDSRFDAVRFVLAGHGADQIPDIVPLRYDYEIRADIADMSSLYSGLRISLAPTRFAGGIPFKVHEGASQGVPVVMTELLGRQLGWEDEPALGVVPASTPEGFVDALARLYFDPEAWLMCQARQAELVTADCSDTLFRNTVRGCLKLPEPALPTSPAPAPVPSPAPAPVPVPATVEARPPRQKGAARAKVKA